MSATFMRVRSVRRPTPGSRVDRREIKSLHFIPNRHAMRGGRMLHGGGRPAAGTARGPGASNRSAGTDRAADPGNRWLHLSGATSSREGVVNCGEAPLGARDGTVEAHCSESAHVHLVNPLWDSSGGADWRTIDTWRAAAPARPVPSFGRVSAVARLHPRIPGPAHPAAFAAASARRDAGVHRHLFPDRSLDAACLVRSGPDPLQHRSAGSSARRTCTASHAPGTRSRSCTRRRRCTASTAASGEVLESPIDVQRFRPGGRRAAARPFTVGRLSRDLRSKHHEEDPRLWRTLASRVAGSG